MSGDGHAQPTHPLTKYLQSRIGLSNTQWGVTANAGLLLIIIALADWHSRVVLLYLGAIIGGVGLWTFFDTASGWDGREAEEEP